MKEMITDPNAYLAELFKIYRILRFFNIIIIIQGDRREPDVFEMISTHLFFNEKAILLQKNLRNYMPFELHIMNER